VRCVFRLVPHLSELLSTAKSRWHVDLSVHGGSTPPR
jgi:hypothetical protein